MDGKTTQLVTRREPVGNVCIIRHDSLNSWLVMFCPGLTGDRTPLGNFGTRGEAEAFASAELKKLQSQHSDKKYLLHADDCPCWQKEL